MLNKERSKFRNNDNWCDFHKDHGPQTEDYQNLDKVLRDLVGEGPLVAYVIVVAYVLDRP